jgi:lysophospholipase L1-like esterase
VRALSEKIFVRYLKRNNELFSEVINAIVSAARARGVPVIILNQPPPHSYPAPKLSPENAANARFLDVRRLYAENPPSMALARAFYSVPNWTSEWKGGYRANLVFAPYKTNIFHPNRSGQKLIADALLKMVLSGAGQGGRK